MGSRDKKLLSEILEKMRNAKEVEKNDEARLKSMSEKRMEQSKGRIMGG